MAKLDDASLPPPRIHPTALIEPGVAIGNGSSVWDGVHVRKGARIGRKCIVGEKTYVAYDVVIGDLVKLNAAVYVCAQVEIEDGVMVAAHTVFTNDRFPRAFVDGHEGLAPSDPNEDTLETVVHTGATIGARAVIGPGLEIGAFSMIGMGAVVAGDVPPHALAFGSPARVHGWVCVCGTPVVRGEADGNGNGNGNGSDSPRCGRCGRRYRLGGADRARRLLPEVA
jgi:UDP-2-acetamido-3-amino-2,3-dideoxy-glucuronate N-acetyltransferase